MGIYSIAKQHSVSLILVLAAFGFIALDHTAMAQNAPPDQNAPAAQPADQNTPAAAQPTSASGEEVTVSAPAREVVRRTVGRSRSTAARVEEVTVDHQIAYNDLDLSKPADVEEFHQRVRAAAQESCSELDRLFPATRSRRATRECVNRAVGNASAQVTAAISGNRGRYGNAGHP